MRDAQVPNGDIERLIADLSRVLRYYWKKLGLKGYDIWVRKLVDTTEQSYTIMCPERASLDVGKHNTGPDRKHLVSLYETISYWFDYLTVEEQERVAEYLAFKVYVYERNYEGRVRRVR